MQCKEASDPDSTEKIMDIMDVSTNPAPKVRSLMPPLCGRDTPSSNNIILRSVLKKPTVKQFAEGFQVNILYISYTHFGSNIPLEINIRLTSEEMFLLPPFYCSSANMIIITLMLIVLLYKFCFSLPPNSHNYPPQFLCHL